MSATGPTGAEQLSNGMYPPCEVIPSEYELQQQGFFSVPGLEEALGRSPGAFFLQPDFAAEHQLGPEDYLLRSSRFALRPDWALGRTDSAHEVYFGELELGVDNGEYDTVAVACKPYSLFDRERAVHEYVALEYFKKSPVLQSFTPLGIWVDQTGRATLLTEFEESVESFDNLAWDRTADDPLKEHFDLFDGLEMSALILGRLHSLGFIHRDAQVKNMAHDRVTQGVRLIDLTSLELVHTAESPRPDEWVSGVGKDLSDLIGTILRRGYLEDVRTERVRDMVQKCLFGMHGSVVRHPATRSNLFKGVEDRIQEIHADILDRI